MELIAQVRDHGSHRGEYRRLAGERITIGRAYDNDLILTDPAVSPHHAVIEPGEDGEPVLRDLASLNGVRSRDGNRMSDSTLLTSGMEWRFGKARVTFYHPDHPVPAAVPLEEGNQLAALVDRPGVFPGLIALVLAVHGLLQWLNMFGEFKWQDIINVLLVVAGSALLIAIFWAVVGRIVRHEAAFRRQLTVVLAFVLIQVVTAALFDWIMFNTLSYGFTVTLMLLSEFVLGAALLWCNLSLATNQTSRQRWRTAVSIAAVLIGLSMYAEFVVNDDFTGKPNYVSVLQPPALRIAGPVSEERFVTDAGAIFARLQEDME